MRTEVQFIDYWSAQNSRRDLNEHSWLKMSLARPSTVSSCLMVLYQFLIHFRKLLNKITHLLDYRLSLHALERMVDCAFKQGSRSFISWKRAKPVFGWMFSNFMASWSNQSRHTCVDLWDSSKYGSKCISTRRTKKCEKSVWCWRRLCRCCPLTSQWH